jgi:hypothetical protein
MSSPKDTPNRNSPKTAVPTQPEIENGLGSPAEKVTTVGPSRKVLFGYVSMGMLQLLVLFWFVTSFLLGKMVSNPSLPTSDLTSR